MGDILLLALRRLRTPLIALISAYAISVLGLTLMPGVDIGGKPADLGFFHAFYIVSYTATTIGFGELPFAFTDAQRAWVTFTIYLSVTCWAYALGSIFALAQDAGFRAAMARSRFTAAVRSLDEPFYVIAGYGQSGVALAHALDGLGFRTVVIELRAERVVGIDVEDYQNPPLALTADARWPEVLRDAGVTHKDCRALIVLVGNDEMAQAIAIGASVLQPDREVIARVHDRLAHSNLDSFPHIRVVDPFATFATNLGLSLAAPSVLWAEEWLTSAPGSGCPKCVSVPQGHWLIFGYGRFGHAVGQALECAGSSWTAIDSNMRLADEPHLQHSDNSEKSLREAGIEHAVGVVACTDRDAINLALVSRARRARPDLCVLIRQNHVADRSLIEASRADLIFVKSEVMVRECLQLLISPLLNRFLMQVREQGKVMAERLIVRLLTELDERVPNVWVFECDPVHPGLREILEHPGEAPLRLDELMIDPMDPSNRLRAVPLLLERNDQLDLLPDANTVLQAGDRVLFAGAIGVETRQRRFLLDPSPLGFVRTGVEPPRSWLFRWLAQRREAQQAKRPAEV
ncbi:MAG: NAD-binding protein [Rhodocyclaceae bacterium]